MPIVPKYAIISGMTARTVTSSVFSNPPLTKEGSEIDHIKNVRLRGTPLQGRQATKKFPMENNEPPYDEMMDWVTENIDTTMSIRYESLDGSGSPIGSTTINFSKRRNDDYKPKNSVIDAEVIKKAADTGEMAMQSVLLVRITDSMLEQHKQTIVMVADQGKVITQLADTLRKNNNGEIMEHAGEMFNLYKEEMRKNAILNRELAVLKERLEQKKGANDKETPIKTLMDGLTSLKDLKSIDTGKMLNIFIDKISEGKEATKLIEALKERSIKDIVNVTAYVSVICAEAASKKDAEIDFVAEVTKRIGEIAAEPD